MAIRIVAFVALGIVVGAFLALALAGFGTLIFAFGFIAILVFLFFPPVTFALLRGPEKISGAVSFLGSYMLTGSLLISLGMF